MARPNRPLVALASAAAAAGMLATAAAPAQAQSQRELRQYRERLEQLFTSLDRNGDGRLSRQEVEGHPYLERHFNRLDRRGRGYLTPAELVPPDASGVGERLQRVFARADANGNGLIDRREAAAFPWLRERFDAADRNGDGRVSLEELIELRRRLPPSADGV